jgi:hypothetical protein
MNCEQFQNIISDYLADNLDKRNKIIFENHAKKCGKCHQELEEIRVMWGQIQTIPQSEPSAGLRVRFYSMLRSFKEEQKQKKARSFFEKISEAWEQMFPLKPTWHFAVLILVLTLGLFIGRHLFPIDVANQEYRNLQSEIGEMRQMVSMVLLKQNSAADRLMGISYSQGIETPEPDLISALFNTLNNDPNVNVRLAAANALQLFSNRTDIRTGLIESLTIQNSPLVQISLINLLVEVRERKALGALNQLFQKETIFPEVKQQAQWGMEQLKSL